MFTMYAHVWDNAYFACIDKNISAYVWKLKFKCNLTCFISIQCFVLDNRHSEMRSLSCIMTGCNSAVLLVWPQSRHKSCCGGLEWTGWIIINEGWNDRGRDFTKCGDDKEKYNQLLNQIPQITTLYLLMASVWTKGAAPSPKVSSCSMYLPLSS